MKKRYLYIALPFLIFLLIVWVKWDRIQEVDYNKLSVKFWPSNLSINQDKPGTSRLEIQPIKQANISIRFAEHAPYRMESNSYVVYRIGIYNAGEIAADNVLVRLIDINPRPRYSKYTADFPYPLFTSNGNESVRINPHDEQLFSLAQSWQSSDGRIIVDGINRKIWMQPYTEVAIEKDELWKLRVRVTAANAKAKEVELKMSPAFRAVRVVFVDSPKQ
jgi:hypothetical protein